MRRAQRLTASEVWAPGQPAQNPKPWQTSAQRLTASEVWAQTALQDCISSVSSCSTPYGIRGLGTLSPVHGLHQRVDVLNALRHQRFGHFRASPCQGERVACSTPYGIRGLGTNRVWRDSGKALFVLNALRHQRFGHSFYLPKKLDLLSVLNALRHQRFGHQMLRRAKIRGECVLNALRHQRFGHGSFHRTRQPHPCAQRLTASEVWAPLSDSIG